MGDILAGIVEAGQGIDSAAGSTVAGRHPAGCRIR